MESELKTFSYEIGGKRYTMKPLVLGQLEELTRFASSLPAGILGIPGGVEGGEVGLKDGLISLLKQGYLSQAIAIVLMPEGVAPKNKDVFEITEEIRWNLDLATGVKIISDFFTCNVLSELLSNMKQFNQTMMNLKTPEE